MLESLKQTGRNLGQEINRAWENLSEGWRELLSRSSHALTHFGRGKDDKQHGNDIVTSLPRWSLLPSEVEETATEIVVRVELPGMEKDDCSITIEGNTLIVSGEKRFERETGDSTYHVMERAYGAFERAVALPRNVDADKAQASYKNGVLTVTIPKDNAKKVKTVPVL